jgi:hypothetical protein
MNWIAIIASMLVQGYAQAQAEKKGKAQIALANNRMLEEQDKMKLLREKDLLNYENVAELEAQDEILENKLAPVIKSIASVTNFQDVDKYDSQGSVSNNAYTDALTGKIQEILTGAKNKANLNAKVKVPYLGRKDQAVNTGRNLQEQNLIGGLARDYFNTVSKTEINNAFKPDQGLMLLSKGLGMYGTGGFNDGSGAITDVPIIDKSHLVSGNNALFNNYNAMGGPFG